MAVRLKAKNALQEAVKDLAARQGLTVYAFANRTAISTAYIQQIFAGGKITVGTEIAIKIADAFGESRLKWLRLAGHGDLVEAILQEAHESHDFRKRQKC